MLVENSDPLLLLSVELVIVPDLINKKLAVAEQPTLELHQERQDLCLIDATSLDMAHCFLQLLLVHAEEAGKDRLIR